MHSDLFVHILDHHILPSLEECGVSHNECIFQQDNDPKHTSGKAKTGWKGAISLFWTSLHSFQTSSLQITVVPVINTNKRSLADLAERGRGVE